MTLRSLTVPHSEDPLDDLLGTAVAARPGERGIKPSHLAALLAAEVRHGPAHGRAAAVWRWYRCHRAAITHSTRN
jgi:hypothetical protein